MLAEDFGNLTLTLRQNSMKINLRIAVPVNYTFSYKSAFLYSYQIVIYLCQKIYLYIKFFLYSYQVHRYSCQNNFPLSMHLCLYQADFFIFDIKKSCQVYAHTLINQEGLVPSISKRKRESENQPYNKQHLFKSSS